MTEPETTPQTPTFISSITWILLGVMVLGAGILYLFTVSVVGSWLWWYGVPVTLIGIIVTYVGYKDFRKFLNKLPDTESGETANIEHHAYEYEETLAEKRP